MKLPKIFGFVFILILSVQGLNQVGGYPEVEKQIELASGVGIQDIQALPFQDHSVFSPATNLFYNFYVSSEGLRCAIVDKFGNIFDNQLILDNSGFYWGGLQDFSVDIHHLGWKVYLIIKLNAGNSALTANGDEFRVYYMAINDETKTLDVLDVETVENADQTNPNWRPSLVDIAVQKDGSILVGMTVRPVGSYLAVIYPSEGDTGFNYDKTKYQTSDDLFFNELATNPPNDYYHSLALTSYGETGAGIYIAIFEVSNMWTKNEAIFRIENVTRFYTNGYEDANFHAEGSITQWSKPDDTSWYIDIVGNYAGTYLVATTQRENGGTSYCYSRYWNATSDTTQTRTIDSVAVNDVSYFCALSTNERDALNAIYFNDTNLDFAYQAKYNQTSASWQNEIDLITWQNSESGAPIDLDNIREVSTGNNFALVMQGTKEPATPQAIIYQNSVEWAYYYLDDYKGEFPYEPNLENNTLVDSNGNSLSTGDWLLEGEIYTFRFDTNNATESGYIQFDDDDATIRIEFNETTNRVTLDRDLEENKISILDYETVNDSWNITFSLGEGIDDNLDVDFSFSVENFYHNVTISGTYIPNLKIYNLGGFTFDRTISNTGGFYPYGHPLEAWSQYNGSSSWVNTSQVYRKLQWWHSQFALDVSDNDVFDTKENTGDVEIHLQYLENGIWQDIIYVSFDIVNGAVDPSGAGAGKAWVDIAWNWYGRNDAGNMASVRNGYFVAYPDCGDDVSSDATTLQLWADLWLDRANNSKAVGGSLNPYYYGMDETGWLLFNSWRPIITNTTFGTVTIPLRNSTGSVIQADQMDLMRISTWVITGSNLDTNVWAVRDFKNQDYLLAEGRLRGIDKPPIVEPIVIDMPSSGFLSGLRKAINALGQTLINALAGAWKSSLGLIDTILEFLGFGEGVFSSLIYVLGEVLDIFDLIIAEFEDIINYAINSITDLLSLVVAVGGRVVFTVNMFVSTILSFYNALVSLFTGGWGNVGDIWGSYDILSWLQLFLVAIFPFWEMDRISKSQNKIGVIKEDVETFIGALTGIMRVFLILWGLIQSLFNLIMNIIRG